MEAKIMTLSVPSHSRDTQHREILKVLRTLRDKDESTGPRAAKSTTYDDRVHGNQTLG